MVFGTSHDITWWQEMARAILVFLYGLILLRIVGRRAFGRWSALDILVSIVIGSNLSRALTGSAPLGGTLAATTLIMACHWGLAHAVALWPAFSRLVEGYPVELARNGRPHSRVMLREGISKADLHEALRQSGVEELPATRLVTLELSGRISIVKA
jgi:uncharacterized membrane protein YcaP (DUF421 family)